MVKLSSTQATIIRTMAQSGVPISRYKGGYWALTGFPPDHFAQSHENFKDCLCAIQTLRSLAKKGLVEVSKTAKPTLYNDGGYEIEFTLTGAGRDLAAQIDQ